MKQEWPVLGSAKTQPVVENLGETHTVDEAGSPHPARLVRRQNFKVFCGFLGFLVEIL